MDGRNLDAFPTASTSARRVARRASPWRICLVTFASLGSLFSLVVVVVVAIEAKRLLQELQWPHSKLAQPNNYSYNALGSIRPLVNSSTPFSLLATVWLDVTDHLKEGNSIASEIQVVNYTQWKGLNRSEAILYSGLLFEGVRMTDRLHTSTRIRVPISPLYSQQIGPASLRATIQVVPHDVANGLLFNGSGRIYPDNLPIGPRSPQSWRLHQNATAPFNYTLQASMETSSLNMNLLTLLPSQWRLNGTRPNIRRDLGRESQMLDGASSNRFFQRAVNNSNSSKDRAKIFVGKENRLFLPHIRTRSRIILINEERSFKLALYWRKWRGLQAELMEACAPFRPGRPNAFSDGSCSRTLQNSMFESLLRFQEAGAAATQRNATSHFFYAPFLTQQVGAAAYRHHRTLPGFSFAPPLNASRVPPRKLASKAEDECLVPMIDQDASGEYFEFDWDVTYSSHTHERATKAEITQIDSELPVKDVQDGQEDIRLEEGQHDVVSWSLQALAFGDREHPNSRPWRPAASVALQVVSVVAFYLFTLSYWWTRTTSQGISKRAAWLAIAGDGIHLFRALTVLRPAGMRFVSALFKVVHVAAILNIALLQIVTVLQIEWTGTRIVRRSLKRKERLTRQRDDSVGVWMPAAVVVSLYLLASVTSKRKLHFVPARGCSNPANVLGGSHRFDRPSFRYLASALDLGSYLMQIRLNEQLNTFAGFYKISNAIPLIAKVVKIAVGGFEAVGGWQASRSPILISDIVEILVLACLVYQACTYPSIPQTMTQDEEDDIQLR